MLATLQRWRTDPPLAGPASLDALNKRARRAERKADRRLAQAIDAGGDALLHRARKAANAPDTPPNCVCPLTNA